MAISGLGDISSLWASVVNNKKRHDLPGKLLTPDANSPTAPASDFASMLSGANNASSGGTQGVSGASNTQPAASTQSTTAMAKPVKPGDSPTDDFLNYMKMTPEQRAQYKWLAAHGITKEQFDAMSDADKAKLMAQMKQEIEDQMQRQAEQNNKDGKTRIPVDILA